MEVLRFVPVKLTLLLVAGILLGKYLAPDPLIAPLLALFAILFLMYLCFRFYPEADAVFAITASVATVALGVLSYSFSLPENQSAHYLRRDIDGEKMLKIKIRKSLKSTAYSRRYLAELQYMNSMVVSGKILLYCSRDHFEMPFDADDELLIRTTLEPIRPALNPYQFNYAEYWKGQGIYHQIRPDAQALCRLDTPDATAYGWAASLRNTIIGRMSEAGMGPKELGIAEALLLGQRNDIPDETYGNYKNAGAVHILAVSGLHIGVLLWLLHLLLKPLERLPRGRSVKLILLLVLLWSYAFLAGFSASVIRSVSMFSFMAYALYLNRPSNTYNILALSMFFVLLTYRPSMLFQAGFQMSYMAVFAILWIYPKLERLWRPRYWVLKKFWQLLSVSLAAQMGVLPISLYYFHQFPGLFFISNLLVLPFLGILLAIGYIAAVLALSDLLPSGLMAAYGVLINGMNSLISWIAGQEAFLFQDLPFDFPRLICSYLIIGALTTILDGAKYRKLVFLFTGIIGLQLWAAYQAFRIRDKEAVWVLQQPHNTVLIHQAGNRMEVASGTEKPAGELLSGLLVGGGVKSVEKRPLHPAYLWKTSVLYILNDSGALPVCMDKNVYLLLTHSPKIHLERILKDVSPRGVIADGSNYSSYVARWKASCKAQQIPFHDTATQGAYMLPME